MSANGYPELYAFDKTSQEKSVGSVFFRKPVPQENIKRSHCCIPCPLSCSSQLLSPNLAAALAKVHTPFTSYPLEVGRKALF
jgi:hypothetical protein